MLLSSNEMIHHTSCQGESEHDTLDTADTAHCLSSISFTVASQTSRLNKTQTDRQTNAVIQSTTTFHSSVTHTESLQHMQ